jgi:predicted DNA repair protein MutK
MAAASVSGVPNVAGASLLALLDDIASVLDDVAILTKVATKKTAGVLGDDLALNAQQVAGVRAERELPVVWAVAKGSLLNKAILVPLALAISAFAAWAVTPLLMIGGLFLCYEGVEKVWHKFAHRREDASHRTELLEALEQPDVDLRTVEKDKIKGAIRTDFILSAEIIVIALGTVAAANFGTRVAVLVGIALLMTVGVYGLVAGIVKLDDAGLHLLGRSGDALFAKASRALGRGILWFAPWLMKALAIAGTAAMFLVGGGILVHGIPALEHWLHAITGQPEGVSTLRAILSGVVPALVAAVVGIIAGAITVAVVNLIGKVRSRQ